MKRFFLLIVAVCMYLGVSAQMVPITWTAYGLTFNAPKGIGVEEDTEDTFLLNNARFYITLHSLESDDMTLIEKSNAFGRSEDNSYGATVCGNFLKKYGNTRLKASFLNQDDFSVWYAASHRGDVAIVELYGKIPVWRTFISEAMLYDSQTNDPYYQLIKDMTSKQMKAVDYIEYLNQSKDNHI